MVGRGKPHLASPEVAGLCCPIHADVRNSPMTTACSKHRLKHSWLDKFVPLFSLGKCPPIHFPIAHFVLISRLLEKTDVVLRRRLYTHGERSTRPVLSLESTLCYPVYADVRMSMLTSLHSSGALSVRLIFFLQFYARNKPHFDYFAYLFFVEYGAITLLSILSIAVWHSSEDYTHTEYVIVLDLLLSRRYLVESMNLMECHASSTETTQPIKTPPPRPAFILIR